MTADPGETPAPTAAGTVDLTDLDMWARGVPYHEFARLRRVAPVAWHDEAPPNSGFWSVHCYQDIVTASRDVATFSSARGISFEEPTDEDMAARRTIIDTDPPDHTKLRKIVSGSFTQRAVAVYEHFVEGLTEQVLDARLADGELEFVDAVAIRDVREVQSIAILIAAFYIFVNIVADLLVVVVVPKLRTGNA